MKTNEQIVDEYLADNFTINPQYTREYVRQILLRCMEKKEMAKRVTRMEMYCKSCDSIRDVSSIMFYANEIRISCDVCFRYTWYEIKQKETDSFGRKIE